MEIKASHKIEEPEFVAEKFVDLGAYVNRIAHTVKGNKYPSHVYDILRHKIAVLYDYLEGIIEDVDYINDERTTLIRALNNLPPVQFQKLLITIVNYWAKVKITY